MLRRTVTSLFSSPLGCNKHGVLVMNVAGFKDFPDPPVANGNSQYFHLIILFT